MEPFKILRHPAAWAIFATDIIGWNCHFHLVIASTSRAAFSSCPSCCQSYCSIVCSGFPGSAWLEAALHCLLPCPWAFPQHLGSKGQLKGCVGLPDVNFLTQLWLRGFFFFVNTGCTCLLQEPEDHQEYVLHGVCPPLWVWWCHLPQQMHVLQCLPVRME